MYGYTYSYQYVQTYSTDRNKIANIRVGLTANNLRTTPFMRTGGCMYISLYVRPYVCLQQ
jgi:hypothetical protein